jgi:thiol:disulfide interchange protein DsbD
MMKRSITFAAALMWCAAASGLAQGLDAEPVFTVNLVADRAPVVAGGDLRLAVEILIEPGWHVNTNDPGDEFSWPTSVEFGLPEGWLDPVVSYPGGQSLEFEFADAPIMVWEQSAVVIASLAVPESATGDFRIRTSVTAQACNNTRCLPPETVNAGVDITVAPAGSTARPVNSAFFERVSETQLQTSASAAEVSSELTSKSLPLLLLGVFLAGLALNLTPCVFPLIPITIGYFTRQTGDREGSAFPLAVAYVLGIAVTYSVLGVLVALSGAIFGSALQSPWVVGLIVVVLLSLATSMFGLWELRVPSWAQRASGGRTGIFGALIMGLVMGFVAAPCIGPFVVGLLTYVGQRGDPIFGFLLFFTLAIGLGVPYLILGTFTGAVNRLPASGMWMIGVRRVFGVILIAMAAYFAAPLMPGDSGRWLMAGVLVLGALYLLVVDRTGHEQPTIDRVMRVVSAAMLVAGVLMAPGLRPRDAAAGAVGGQFEWQPYDAEAAEAAISSGAPVIIDFYADWCAPCRELDEKTFADQAVRDGLAGYVRLKVNLTRSSEANQALVTEYGVLGVPTVIVFMGGDEAFRITGFEPPERFLKRLRSAS